MTTQNHFPYQTNLDSSGDTAPLGYPVIAPTRADLGPTHSRHTWKSVASMQANTAPNVAESPVAAAKTTPPLPKRPRGRFFIATVLILLFAGSGFAIFETFVRYEGYGEVTGRKIQVSTPWSGVVSQLQVRVGDRVRQGDVLFTVENTPMQHRVAEINDKLQLERARLTAEISRLRRESERVRDEDELVKADYYERQSELLWEQSVLSDLEQQVKRAIKLKRNNAISSERFDTLTSQLVGQEQRVKALSGSVDRLKVRTLVTASTETAIDDQVKPVLVKIENLQAELARTQQILNQGVVKCPADARVTRINRYLGEQATASDGVVELLIDGSTEIVLYVSQRRNNRWAKGEEVKVLVSPYDTPLMCRIAHIGPEMRTAPPSIMRHYSADEALLPIVMRPIDADQAGLLVIGSKVRLPRSMVAVRQNSSVPTDASTNSRQPYAMSPLSNEP
ncbi:HlyD family secretion protein [Planctomycetes bacterium K23_9]|uniref:Multidrug resistance protein MdtN n=1 Tax=Stieleria marina TaxID=1930275 RepID=A0A517NXJ6_9BACT|nr:multidrug resistance protein MdtN [Planctomycetes bacterium K23_9]